MKMTEQTVINGKIKLCNVINLITFCQGQSVQQYGTEQVNQPACIRC